MRKREGQHAIGKWGGAATSLGRGLGFWDRAERGSELGVLWGHGVVKVFVRWCVYWWGAAMEAWWWCQPRHQAVCVCRAVCVGVLCLVGNAAEPTVVVSTGRSSGIWSGKGSLSAGARPMESGVSEGSKGEAGELSRSSAFIVGTGGRGGVRENKREREG